MNISGFTSNTDSIVEVGIEHAEVLAELHRRCFPEAPWSAKSITGILVQNSNGGLAYCVDGVPIGFVLLQIVASEAEILTFCIDPEWRGKGYSRLLIAKVLNALNQKQVNIIFLEVAEDNFPALSIYSSVGFVEIARRHKYYHKRGGAAVDAVVMQLDILKK